MSIWQAPEQTTWTLCGTGPMQDEYHVKSGGRVLAVFRGHERGKAAAERFREWYIAGEYKRIGARIAAKRDAASAVTAR